MMVVSRPRCLRLMGFGFGWGICSRRRPDAMADQDCSLDYRRLDLLRSFRETHRALLMVRPGDWDNPVGERRESWITGRAEVHRSPEVR